jgi:acyl-CoA synthetase (AMP-forming)/AMP-acid ligase II
MVGAGAAGDTAGIGLPGVPGVVNARIRIRAGRAPARAHRAHAAAAHAGGAGDLAVVQPRGHGGAAPGQAGDMLIGRVLTDADFRFQALALAGWLQQVALFMQNCPQFLVAFYAAVRADAVVVPVNPMNRAGEFQHDITDPQTRVVICTADVAETVAATNRELPADPRVPQMLVTRCADALPQSPVDPAEAPPEAMAPWLLADPPLPAEGGAIVTRWAAALAAGGEPGPHTARPGELVLLALHLGHDRRADVPHHRADARRARLGVERLDRHRDDALGP